MPYGNRNGSIILGNTHTVYTHTLVSYFEVHHRHILIWFGSNMGNNSMLPHCRTTPSNYFRGRVILGPTFVGIPENLLVRSLSWLLGQINRTGCSQLFVREWCFTEIPLCIIMFPVIKRKIWGIPLSNIFGEREVVIYPMISQSNSILSPKITPIIQFYPD